MNNISDTLDVFGQQPDLDGLYTQLTFIFPASTSTLQSSIVETLTNALTTLTTAFPWLAGQVTCTDGVYSIVPLDKLPQLVIKDAAMTMDSLRQANFPFSMLHEEVVAPRNTLTLVPTPTYPVLLLQATFITGGVLLTFVTQHNVMDMTGQGEIMRLFSKACRGEPFTSVEIANGNLSREEIVPLLDDYTPGPELDIQMVKPPPPPPAPTSLDEAPPTPPKCSWVYYTFSASALSEIKASASSTLPPDCKFISTDDALTTYIYRSISCARMPRLTTTTKATLGRAIDTRSALGIPVTYNGVIQSMTYHTFSIEELMNLPMGVVTANLRAALDKETTSFRTRSFATYLSQTSDKNSISVTASIDPSTDITLSSWSKVDAYNFDFGPEIGGKAECVRRPGFAPYESLMYLMPKTRDGSISVGMSLREEDVDKLNEDEEWTKYAEYVG